MGPTHDARRAAALSDLENGYPIVIIPQGKKAPNERNWQEGIRSAQELNKRWDARRDRPNYGIVLREGDRLLLVDVDVKNGSRGPETLRKWVEATKLEPKRYALQRTPSGGAHLLGRIPVGYPRETLPNNGTAGIDLFRHGRQFVRAPSETPAGKYEAIRPLPPLATLPEWPIEFLDHLASLGGTSKRNDPAPLVEDVIPEGKRNNTLASLAGTMRRPGMSEEEIGAALLVANENRCSPPLPREEVLRIARSIAKKAPAHALPQQDAYFGESGISPPPLVLLNELNETYAVVQVGGDVRIRTRTIRGR